MSSSTRITHIWRCQVILVRVVCLSLYYTHKVHPTFASCSARRSRLETVRSSFFAAELEHLFAMWFAWNYSLSFYTFSSISLHLTFYIAVIYLISYIMEALWKGRWKNIWKRMVKTIFLHNSTTQEIIFPTSSFFSTWKNIFLFIISVDFFCVHRVFFIVLLFIIISYSFFLVGFFHS